MANPNANSATLAGGGSTAVQAPSPPGPRVTAADMFPLRMQNLTNIEGKGGVKRTQFPADRGKYYMELGLHDYSRSSGDLMSVITKLDISDKIILPLPQQMVDTHNVNYEQQEVGQATTALAELGQGAMTGDMTNIAQGFAGLGSSLISALGNAIKGGVGLNAAEAARAFTGLASNQFLTVLLKGPQYKKHSFTWKLSPRNEAESESVRSIIALLNNSMAPGLFMGNQYFTFPKIVTISFMPNSNVLYRFKPAVIENMTVNYAPSGAPAFYRRTEAPDTVEIKLDFMEVEYWLTGDFGGSSIATGSLTGQQGSGRVGGAT